MQMAKAKFAHFDEVVRSGPGAEINGHVEFCYQLGVVGVSPPPQL